MKKNFAVIAALFFCGALFTSFSPSLDGRAVVADDGVLPKGIFAKTVGYLPGDSISVTNLTNKSTVEILVIGAIDPSEGVAILLSPEAAGLLGVEKGSNSVVKITKRSGQLDEAVAGTAIIGEGANVEENREPAEESAEDDTDESVVTEADESVEVEDNSGDVIAETEKAEESVEAEEIPAEDAGVSEENADVAEEKTEIPEENADVAEEKIEIPEENADVAEEKIEIPEENADISEPIADDISEPENEEVEEKLNEEVVSEEAVSENNIGEEKIDEERIDEEKIDEESADEEKISEPSADVLADSEEDNERVDDYLVQETPEDISEKVDGGELSDIEENEPNPSENQDDSEKIAESVPESKYEEPIASEKIDEDEPGALDNDKDDKIIAEDKIESQEAAEEMIPAPFEEDSVATETPEKVYADSLSENIAPEPLKDDTELSEIETPAEEAVTETAAPEIVEKPEENYTEEYDPIVLVPTNPNPPEEVKIDADTEIAEYTENEKNVVAESDKSVKANDMYDFAENTVASLKELESGKYYVQIAVLKDSANIKSIFDKYYGKYPITLVPLAGGAARQVLIGPLSVDEYGTVMNRFKSYGYKDAFLRKIR